MGPFHMVASKREGKRARRGSYLKRAWRIFHSSASNGLSVETEVTRASVYFPGRDKDIITLPSNKEISISVGPQTSVGKLENTGIDLSFSHVWMRGICSLFQMLFLRLDSIKHSLNI